MERIIYVFIKEDAVKCYPNLKQLSKDNPEIRYFQVYRALRKSNTFRKGNITVAVNTMKWKTKRKPPHSET